MGQLLLALIQTVRPRQWLKNFAVFTTILFTGQLFNGLKTILVNAKPEWVEDNGYVAIHSGNIPSYQEVPEAEKLYFETIRKINLGDMEVITSQDSLLMIEQ